MKQHWYNEYKMSPTSISGGGKLLTGGELISPASLKGQEEVLPTAKLEQWPYNYLWIWSVIYFSLGFFNILFAWLGLISFFLPLIFAIGFGNKHFCNRYCDRGQLLRMLGSQRGFSRKRDMPAWMKSRGFRYGFLIFFLLMFANVLYATYLVAGGARDVAEFVTLFWTCSVPWAWASSTAASPWAVQFAYGFYSLMLTSALLGIITMLFYKPRSWCVYCPMGTMTQLICKAKAGED